MTRGGRGWVVGVAAATATAVAVAAARHAPVPQSSPVDPLGAWHDAWIASVVAALALAGAGVLLARRGALGLRTALVVAVVVQALPLFAPLLLSRDVTLYWAEARVLAVHHANPYRVTPASYPDDPATRVTSEEWRALPDPYGPAWLAASTVPTVAAGTSQHRAELLFRLLAFAAVLATLGLVASATRSAQAVALLGWSPLVALHYAGGGHSDALLVLVLTAAIALGARRAGGAAWSLAAMFKPVPVVVLPLELARRRLQMGRRFWGGLVASAVVLLAVATSLFGTAWVRSSVDAAQGTSPIGGVHFLTETGLRHRYAVVVAGLVFLVVYAVLLRIAWRRGRAHAGFALVALCMCSSLLRPWYALWPLAVAALEEDGLSIGAAYALSVYVLVADALPL